ncbi:MAG: hypothetical protein R2867_37935 [Caldilineaceae bacterium]
MSTLVDRLTIVHNEHASRFEAEIDGQLAVVEYERRGDVLYITHTGTRCHTGAKAWPAK